MSIVARGLARGAAAGFIVAAGLGLGATPVSPPVPPPAVESSAFAPGAMTSFDNEADERERIRLQNDTILAFVMSAVNSRILE